MAYGIADDFTRSDSSDLGDFWAEAVGGWSVSDGQASSTGGGSNTARHTTPLANGDHRATVTVAGTLAGPAIRINEAGSNYFRIFFNDASTLRVQRVDAGSPTSFDETFTEPDPPYELTLAADGTDVIGFVDGTEATRLAGENSHSANVHAGFFAAGAGRTVDDWSADLTVLLAAQVTWASAGANRIERGA